MAALSVVMTATRITSGRRRNGRTRMNSERQPSPIRAAMATAIPAAAPNPQPRSAPICQAMNAPRVMNTPWAKLKMPSVVQMRERPVAIRA